MIAYFIRREGETWAVIGICPDEHEEVVQSGLTLIEAEMLCDLRVADRRPVIESPNDGQTHARQPRWRRPHQLRLRF